MKLSERAMLAAGIDPRRQAVQVQPDKAPFRNHYADGPMAFVAQQVLKRMADKGWSCRVFEHWRSPERQEQMIAKGVSKAGPWRSAHQYGLAVDIIHATRAWDVPERFWEDMAAVVRVIEETYKVDLEHGHRWKFRDSAHIELKNFRKYRDLWGQRTPTEAELDACFAAEMPAVWKAHVRSGKARCRLR